MWFFELLFLRNFHCVMKFSYFWQKLAMCQIFSLFLRKNGRATNFSAYLQKIMINFSQKSKNILGKNVKILSHDEKKIKNQKTLWTGP